MKIGKNWFFIIIGWIALFCRYYWRTGIISDSFCIAGSIFFIISLYYSFKIMFNKGEE